MTSSNRASSEELGINKPGPLAEGEINPWIRRMVVGHEQRAVDPTSLSEEYWDKLQHHILSRFITRCEESPSEMVLSEVTTEIRRQIEALRNQSDKEDFV